MAEQVRVYGPERHGQRWRVITARGVGASRKRLYRSFATRAAADAFAEGARGQATGRTVGDAVKAWIDVKRGRGREDLTIKSIQHAIYIDVTPALDAEKKILPNGCTGISSASPAIWLSIAKAIWLG